MWERSGYWWGEGWSNQAQAKRKKNKGNKKNKETKKRGLKQQGDKGERIGGAYVLLREERVMTHP